MAAASKSCRILALLYSLQTFFIVVLAVNNIEQSQYSPFTILDVQNIDGSYLSHEETSKTHYVHIRSITSPPIKKAMASSEKKISPKTFSTESSVSSKTLAVDAKYKVEDSSLSNSTETNTTLIPTIHQEEKNLTTHSVVSSTNVTESTLSSSTESSTLGSSTTVVSTTQSPSSTISYMPDPLPTKPSTIKNTTVDHHVYYNSTLYLEEESAMSFWVDFDKLPQNKVVVHRMLSDSHRKAATVRLSFDFPFYGHPLRNITIATGGFIYMGDYMHSWLAATQYIAPLMANFDTSLSNESTVRFYDNGTAFFIEWHEVTLQDEKKGTPVEGGTFTFQTILLKSGDVIFVYEIIPIPVTEIGDELHPVKVGLSDAYVIDRVIYFIRRKTIYEYHRIDMKKNEISNKTAIYFTALSNCMSHKDCTSCMTTDTGLECVWCESAKRCSDGLDRLRQAWINSKCDMDKLLVNCSNLPKPDVNPFVQPYTDSPFKPYTIYPHTSNNYATTTYPRKSEQNNDDGATISARVSEESNAVGVGSVVAILLILAVVLGGLVWVGYAYRNPHTSSGQMLIRYRPSTWRFRSGEARYTAASVHM